MKRSHHLLFPRSVLSSLSNQDPNRRPRSNLLGKARSSVSKNLNLQQTETQNQNIPPADSDLYPLNPIMSMIEQQKLTTPLLTPHQKEAQLFQKLKQSKQNQQIFKNTIKTKFLQVNRRPNQYTSENVRALLPDCRVSTMNSSCAKTSQSFLNQKQQINQWLKRTKALKQSNSTSVSKVKIQLKNIDKFNIDFVEYLKKKSYRRIEKEKINKIISRKQNIIEMYQEHLIKNSGLGLKSKQSMRKCFDILNNEKRRN